MYGALTYRGDLSHLAEPLEVPREDGGTTRTVPHLLGRDPFGRPYEVLDVEYVPGADCNTCDGEGTTELEDDGGRVYAVEPCPGCAGGRGYSTVHLGPASVESSRGNRARVLHHARAEADAIAQRARVAAFWRPDLYSAPALGVTADAA